MLNGSIDLTQTFHSRTALWLIRLAVLVPLIILSTLLQTICNVSLGTGFVTAVYELWSLFWYSVAMDAPLCLAVAALGAYLEFWTRCRDAATAQDD